MFSTFLTTLAADAAKSNYFDFEKNPQYVSNRGTTHSKWPYIPYKTGKTKPGLNDDVLKAGLTKDVPAVVRTRSLLNFVQLVNGFKVNDVQVIGVRSSGYVSLIPRKDLSISAVVTPPPVAALKLTTDLTATAKAGDKLSVVWSGGVAPYSVKVTDDKGALIVDYVDLKAATTYEYDTTTKGAGAYQITVKDSSATPFEVQSVVCTVS